jgi:hypothetical protein
MQKRKFLATTAMALIALGATTSMAVAMADRQVWPRSAWHQDHYQAVAGYLRPLCPAPHGHPLHVGQLPDRPGLGHPGE